MSALPDPSYGPAAATAEQSERPNPEVCRSGPPSAVSLALAVLLRLFLRPMIALAAWISAVGIRLGPSGIEMWRIWHLLLRLTDWIGVLVPRHPGTEVERVRLLHCRGELVRAAGVSRGGPTVLYFHGGGYVGCGVATHRRLVSGISHTSGATVFNVGYRMLPRHPITVAVEDGLAAYRRLLDSGTASDRIVFGGDSAGGGLAFLVAVAARERGLPVPAGIFALSPWAELDPTHKLSHRNARRDPVIPIRAAAFVVEVLISKGDPLELELSPVNLDLSGLPPVAIHVGTTEVFEYDALLLSERLADAGVRVQLKLWTGQVHVFPGFGLDFLPEARRAVREIGDFVRAHAA